MEKNIRECRPPRVHQTQVLGFRIPKPFCYPLSPGHRSSQRLGLPSSYLTLQTILETALGGPSPIRKLPTSGSWTWAQALDLGQGSLGEVSTGTYRGHLTGAKFPLLLFSCLARSSCSLGGGSQPGWPQPPVQTLFPTPSREVV